MSHAPPSHCVAPGERCQPQSSGGSAERRISDRAGIPVVDVTEKGPNRRERALSIPTRLPCMAEEDDGPLVGRTGTLADVQSDLRNAGPGGTAAVFVTGESGVGKSRLLREAARAMRGAGFAVLSGACLDI